MHRKKKICFVGMDNYPVLNPAKGSEYIGGESVQQTLLSMAFRDLGYSVSMLVKDFGQQQGETIDGIRVWKAFRDEAGFPVLRYVHPRLTSIWSALEKADADIYYQSCAGMLTGVVSHFCRKYKRTFVFRLAHDTDCIPGQQLIRFWRDRKIYEYGLRRADLIVAQGVRQIELLRRNYDLSSTMVNMAVELPKPDLDVPKSIDVLWVNNFRDFKRPELVPELARRLPDKRIVMIGGEVIGQENLYDEVRKEAGQLPNIDFIGPVPYQEVNDYFARSRIFVNTSDSEGYPNSFLQAWVRGVPVVSFFDPDGLIKSRGLGAVPCDLNKMEDSLRRLLADDVLRSSIGLTAQQFVLENYSPAAVAQDYDALLNALAKS